jgi:hypothetical protein
MLEHSHFPAWHTLVFGSLASAILWILIYGSAAGTVVPAALLLVPLALVVYYLGLGLHYWAVHECVWWTRLRGRE